MENRHAKGLCFDCHERFHKDNCCKNKQFLLFSPYEPLDPPSDIPPDDLFLLTYSETTPLNHLLLSFTQRHNHQRLKISISHFKLFQDIPHPEHSDFMLAYTNNLYML